MSQLKNKLEKQLKNILENKRLKSFLSFQNNINNTITELKKKDFSFNQYKINSLLYILIIFLVFSSFGNGEKDSYVAETKTSNTSTTKEFSQKQILDYEAASYCEYVVHNIQQSINRHRFNATYMSEVVDGANREMNGIMDNFRGEWHITKVQDFQLKKNAWANNKTKHLRNASFAESDNLLGICGRKFNKFDQ